MPAYYLAPMAELSHRALRELIEDFGGCDEYFSEMISAGALLAGGPFEKWYIDSAPKPEKLVFQLVGSDPHTIARSAAFLDKLECAGIDINMGCSAPLIRKTGAGAAWMASIDKAGQLISLVRPVVKHRLSVKLRIGFKDDFDYLVSFCRRLEEEGAELITLHPRLVCEKFKGLAKWEYTGLLKKELKIKVAGNGDVSSPQDLVRRAAGSCDAVMVGRAAVRLPWIFKLARSREQLAENTSVPGFVPDIEGTGFRFIELLAKHQPPEFFISRARRFFSFFCDNLKWGTYLKNSLNREDSLAGIEKVWREFFKEGKEGG
ncbi:MAG: tRNA-dihydrouridine synthase family protein [Treponema sp.]|nr:tRNA-dihydrouridine synthase family protein [Treponema sp.]